MQVHLDVGELKIIIGSAQYTRDRQRVFPLPQIRYFHGKHNLPKAPIFRRIVEVGFHALVIQMHFVLALRALHVQLNLCIHTVPGELIRRKGKRLGELESLSQFLELAVCGPTILIIAEVMNFRQEFESNHVIPCFVQFKINDQSRFVTETLSFHVYRFRNVTFLAGRDQTVIPERRHVNRIFAAGIGEDFNGRPRNVKVNDRLRNRCAILRVNHLA